MRVVGGRGSTASETGTTSAINKAFTALRILRASPVPVTVTALAKGVGVAPSSAHAILGHLVSEGAVVQLQDKRYTLGPALFHLGASFAAGTPVYRSMWLELGQVANELGVTAAVAVPWDDHHLVLNAHAGGPTDIAIPFGGRIPLAASSWGKVYYGWSGEPVPPVIPRYTERSVTDRDALLAEVEEARTRGYAVDEGEYADDVGGVCAPVTSADGYEGLASLIAPLERLHHLGTAVLGRRLAGLASRASLALGDSERVRFFGSR
jgi:IclR family acetate operon transcriptional repressor